MRCLVARFNWLVWVSVALSSGPDGVRATTWFEGWETAVTGSYRAVYEETTFIDGDLGYWYVGDTWSNDPERGRSPHEARVTLHNGSKALLLFSEDTETGISDNIWVELRDFVTHNPGFSIPITPTTVISFDETGDLSSPSPWRGPTCIFPPCGDSINLELTDNVGHIVVYVLQRPAGAQPDVGNPGYGTLYTEIFLDPAAGRQTRNVYDDFSTLTGFNPAGARITSIAFEVDEHGWAVLDNLFISDSESPPAPRSPAPIDIDWIYMTSAKGYRVGVPESAEPWWFRIIVYFTNGDAVHHIDLTKPGDSTPFDAIQYGGDNDWDWESDESYSSLASLRADYPLGVYKLELQNASHTTLKTLNLDYSNLPGEPAHPVNFTYPTIDGQEGVSTNPTLTWTVGSADGDALMMELKDYSADDEEIALESPVPMSTTSLTPGPLVDGHEYNASISVCKVKNWVGPDWPLMMADGVPVKYAFMTEYINEVSFITAGTGGLPHDWNDDGIVSIVGDVPPFVNCVYFGNCVGWPYDSLLTVGDCNHDGIISIVGDVPCFVGCVYFGICPP